ncbi:hypothetical protein [Marinobacter metalliresistant]|uniref:Uncharacterized protein n=1 Tax=Marinobacter metalliresistant TaxID=2961995 RepID=A0ABZ2W2R7_9GAMM
MPASKSDAAQQARSRSASKTIKELEARLQRERSSIQTGSMSKPTPV